MEKAMKTKSTFFALLVALVTLSPAWVLAQQAPQGRKWTAQNPQNVKFNSEGAHFLSRDPKDRPNTITTPLHLAPGKPWEVSFDVQMIPTVGGGMSVHLAKGAIELCWLGAGDFYKYISGFLTTGNDKMVFNQPWDDHWHTFSYKSDGKMLSLWHNGAKCGETALTEIPDTLSVESTGMELRVENIHIISQAPDVAIANKINAPQQIKAVNKSNKPVKTAFKGIVSHGQSASKRRQSLQAMRPLDYPPMADGSPRPDGMTDTSARQISIAKSQNRSNYTSQPNADLKRIAEDYQSQIAPAKIKGDLYLARLEIAISENSEEASAEADEAGKSYQQELRDLVTTFSKLRATPGYAEHYIETGWVFDGQYRGYSDNIPGAAELKNISPR